jgi:hypothetical protein
LTFRVSEPDLAPILGCVSHCLPPQNYSLSKHKNLDILKKIEVYHNTGLPSQDVILLELNGNKIRKLPFKNSWAA